MEEKEIIKEMMAGDEPINNEDEDLLGWGEYARLIANAVGNPTSEASMVYAINGVWGSGKSSLLNLVEQKILKAQAEAEKEALTKGIKINARKTVIVHFEPWNCVDQNGIIKSFFDTFESVLSLRQGKGQLARIMYGVEQVVDATGKIFELVPTLSSFAPVFRAAGKLLSKYRKSLLGNMKSLESRKNELEQYLAQQKEIRFLFIIDDLDRLNVSEIRLLMQLMKSVCNFRNVSYLLAFDRRIVARALDGEQPSGNGSGESYLSKIVQASIDVPVPPGRKITSLICTSLKPLFDEREEDTKRIDYLINFLSPLFKNLRSAKRYLKEATFVIDEFNGEIDPTDLAAITAVKCIDEKAYNLFFKYQQGLLGKNESEREHFEKEYALTVLGQVDSSPLLCWYGELFPNAFKENAPINDSISNWHICNPNVFKAYQNLVPFNSAFPHKKIEQLLNIDGSDFARECVKMGKELSREIFKAKLYQLLPKEDGIRNVLRLASDLSNAGMERQEIFVETCSFWSLNENLRIFVILIPTVLMNSKIFRIGL